MEKSNESVLNATMHSTYPAVAPDISQEQPIDKNMTPPVMLWSVVGICVLPFLLTLLGFDFSSQPVPSRSRSGFHNGQRRAHRCHVPPITWRIHAYPPGMERLLCCNLYPSSWPLAIIGSRVMQPRQLLALHCFVQAVWMLFIPWRRPASLKPLRTIMT